jgi:hypothetical protein
MPIGYKYNPSNDLGYVNWAEVSKGFSDMLLKERDDREKRKEAYAKQDREISQLLASAEMGQFKDGNDFLSNYVDAMTQQRLIDYRMFKRGLLKEKDYVLKTNNAIDGTNTMFAVQKKWQTEAKRVMEGISKGELQQLNNFNMATIQGFSDFSNSKAVIDPNTGVVNVGKLKLNKDTGIMELTKEVMPVNLAFRTLSTDIATYDADGVTTKFVGGLGTLKDAVVQAATTSRAGSVTSFVGPEAFSKYPQSKDVIQNFNKAIDQYLDAQLENPYNLTSVLTENTGLYDSESFTYDKDIAASDPTKILLKVDPGTKLPVPDRESPNYKKQFGEAKDYMRTQILSKIDRERSIQTSTGQLSTQYAPEYVYGAQKQSELTTKTGEMLAALYSGNSSQVNSAINYFKGLENVSDVERTKDRVIIYYRDGRIKPIDLTAAPKSGEAKVGIGVRNFVKAGTMALLGQDVSLKDAQRDISKYEGKPLSEYQYLKQAVTSPSQKIQSESIANKGKLIKMDDNTSETINKLTAAYGKYGFGFIRPEGEAKGMVIITSPTGKTQTINVYPENEDISSVEDAITSFMTANAPVSTGETFAQESGGNKAPR